MGCVKQTLVASLVAVFCACDIADADIYFEPEIGVFAGKYQQIETSSIAGLQTGFSTGISWERYQAGVEANYRVFETNDANQSLYYTNIPIGLSFRIFVLENWRILVSWYWDDVLYKDFRFKFQEGFKLPKDYDIAYEGPGSWKLGLSYNLFSNIYINQTLFPQVFKTYKRRRPNEVIGDANPQIKIWTYTITISILL